MTRRTWRLGISICVGLILLGLALASLLPIMFIGDPVEGAYGTQRLVILSFMLLSFAFGSLALMLFLRVFDALRNKPGLPRRSNVLRGVGLVVAAGILYWLSFVAVRSSILLLSLCLVMLYAGGGYLLISLRRAE